MKSRFHAPVLPMVLHEEATGVSVYVMPRASMEPGEVLRIPDFRVDHGRECVCVACYEARSGR